MSEPPVHPDLQRQLGELFAGIADRTSAETWYGEQYDGHAEASELRFREALESIRTRFAATRTAARQECEVQRNDALRQFQGAFNTANSKYHAARQQVDSEFGVESLAIENELEEARWMATSVLDVDAEDSPKRQLETLQERLHETRELFQRQSQEVDDAYRNAVDVLQRRRHWRDPVPSESEVGGRRSEVGGQAATLNSSAVQPPRDRKEALNRFEIAHDSLRRRIPELVNLPLSRLTAGWNLPVLLLLAWLAMAAALFFADTASLPLNLPRDPSSRAFLGGGIALIPTVLLGLALFGLNAAKVSARLRGIQNSMHELRAVHQQWRELSKAELTKKKVGFRRWNDALQRDRRNTLRKIDGIQARRMDEARAKQRTALDAVEAQFAVTVEELERARDAQIEAIEARIEQKSAALDESETQEIEAATRLHAQLIEKLEANERRDRASIAKKWQSVLTHTSEIVDREQQACRQSSPDWGELSAVGWTLPAEIPESIRFGKFECELAQLPDGVPRYDWLPGAQIQYELPATLGFSQRASLLLEARDGGRQIAVNALRTIMLRLLTSLPAGKVRFTVIDPVGLGEPFSAFMHLADVDELMIGSRIWTEPAHVEKRLAELSEHMENVFQAYLRNEFASIDEYNRHAGEVAEPYHILVVANFPVNFSEEAARRLANIAQSGPRCGVYTLVSVDMQQALPHNFDLSDLEHAATTLKWKSGRFIATEPHLQELPLTLDDPPEPKDFSRIVRAAGRQSIDARRVEVPFERIAPRNGDLWSLSSRSGIDVPLGRAGATKLQSLSLGRGTSQHVLVAGKTGSGKSTFLHTLVTNLSLYYAPDQVEFYLIDFKKGVEFKTYAAHALPHARVIGIESDREFGVAALERLDAVLKERGELFRSHGVQDLASYREKRGQDSFRPQESHDQTGRHSGEKSPDPFSLPRILLVIDEFQEFFTEDDALSQTAALLLDRLVRQGRAFGIHVLLGSQTLGGAYTLARSTLGQIAVRIALQCSDSDAHLILSEENTAARLLTRPGEAIYNDANGLLEGNHPFQIAWLPEDQRERYLGELRTIAGQRGVKCEPPIVFEGNVASDVRKNGDVVRLFESFATRPKGFSSVPGIWLGEAVSLQAPTRVKFHRRTGNNLLIVGQDAEAAHGLLAVAYLTLAAQQRLWGDSFSRDSEALRRGARHNQPPGASPRLTDEASEPGASALRLMASSESRRNGSFWILDGNVRNDGDESAWTPLIAVVPHATQLAGPHNAGEVIAQLADEVRRRSENGSDDAPPLFLFISDLSRFRDLRNDADDFGFQFNNGDEEKPPAFGTLLADVLRDGPAVGVHAIVWCDSYGNLTRWMSLQTQREFDRKVAFRMNGSDSSNLIDTPAAARLGVHRALLYHGDSGAVEKFRPYAAPPPEWVAWAGERFRGEPSAPQDWDDIASLTVM
jgi:ABC-type multidrug transport system fused ATPase/permease subunit